MPPGDTRGSGNAWFGVRGAFTRTLAYWRRVMTDAFDLIAQMTEAIEGLYRSLCASDARNVDLEAQNTTLVEQLKARTAECEGHAQRCRVAERTAERAGLEATRRLAELGEEHTKQGGALWMRYTQAVGEAGRALEAERAAHQQTRAAATLRGVLVSPQAASRELAAAAKLRSVEAQYVVDREALRVVQRLVVDALRFQHEEQRRQQRKAFQELEEECRSAQAERDALQDRFVGEWQRFGGRADQHVASLSAVMSKGRAMRGRRPHASHRVVTPVGRVLTSQERALASRRREISDPYMSDVCAKLGEIHLPCVPRPPASAPGGQASNPQVVLFGAPSDASGPHPSAAALPRPGDGRHRRAAITVTPPLFHHATAGWSARRIKPGIAR